MRNQVQALQWPQNIFTRVGTYVQRGSMFCFVVLVLVGTDTLIRILHYCPISPCFQHIFAPLHTALRPLSWQPCARLPGSLARACPAALLALARQPCARCCPDKSEQVQQNITPDTSTGFDACARSLARSLAPQSPHCTTVAGHQTACARCCPDGFKLVFSPISLCFHYLHERAAVQQKGSNLFSCSYVDLLHHN
jgi:hypothetical protein